VQSLANQFLIAMPALNDPNFERSVTLICLHDEQGALGVVINRPADMTMSAVFDQLEIDEAASRDTAAPVYLGGPVEPQLGLVLHDSPVEYESGIRVSDELALTLSLDVLQAIAAGDGPDRSRMFLGYAGWGAGQLESEMVQNAWLTVEADLDIVFDTQTDAQWDKAARKLGVDLTLLSSDSGHA